MKFHKNGTLPKDMVFVFGSNLAGRHGKGAALVARNRYGAEYGNGEGIQGNSYALPTKDKRIKSMNLSAIQTHIREFIQYAAYNKNINFFITAVGCGLAGYKHEQIAPLFYKEMKEYDYDFNNCSFPNQWREYLTND